MPHQLLQFFRPPFLGFLHMRPLLQSLGMTFCSQILAKNSVKTLEAVVISAISSSASSESIPGAFLFFICLTAVSTSAWEGGSVFMSVSSSGSWSAHSGLLSSSSKCLAHLTACSLSVVVSLPCLSLTSSVQMFLWSLNYLVILYTELSCPLAATISASRASFSIKALLSLRALLLTSKSFVRYSSFAHSASLSDLALSSLSLVFFSHLFFIHVWGVIHCLSPFFLRPKTVSAVFLCTFEMLSHVPSTMFLFFHFLHFVLHFLQVPWSGF